MAGGTIIELCFSIDFVGDLSADAVVASKTVRWGFTPIFCELNATEINEAGTMDIAVEDDTGTPKAIVATTGLADQAQGASAPVALAIVNTSTQILEGAVVNIIMNSSNAADLVAGGTLSLWVIPLF